MKYFYKSYELENDDLPVVEVQKIWATVHPEIGKCIPEQRWNGIHFITRDLDDHREEEVSTPPSPPPSPPTYTPPDNYMEEEASRFIPSKEDKEIITAKYGEKENPEPKNNDNRTSCYWCGGTIKETPGFTSTYYICEECGKW